MLKKLNNRGLPASKKPNPDAEVSKQAARLEIRRHFSRFSNRVIEGWNEVPSETKNARMSTPSKEPTELIGWKRWDSPRRNLIPDPARGDNHNRSQTPLQKPYLGRQRSTHKYTQVGKTLSH
jgi:hypothetical protein